MKKKLVALLVSLVFLANIGYAEAASNGSNGSNSQEDQEQAQDRAQDRDMDCQEDQEQAQDRDRDAQGNQLMDQGGMIKVVKENNCIQERIRNFNELNSLNQKKEELQLRLQANVNLNNSNMDEIEKLQVEVSEINKQMKCIREQLRLEVRLKYTNEELMNFQQIRSEIKNRYMNMLVLDMDSIIFEQDTFKFDTPPIICDGMTLVPLYEFANGLNAKFYWNEINKKATITKDDKVIVLIEGESIAYINGEAVEMNIQTRMMNSRMLVPLRMLAESFGLKVRWNYEEQTIELLNNNI